MASGAYKKAFTGLTGMAVSRNPTHTLGVLYRYLIKQDIIVGLNTTALILKTITFLDWKCYILHSYSKNLRALAKMPADFPYRFKSPSIFPKYFLKHSYQEAH